MELTYDEMKQIPVFSSLKEAVSFVCGTDTIIEKKQPVHGGDANDAYKLFISNGSILFLKANTLANADFFRAEAEGIAAIRSTGKVRVPIIYARGKDSGFSFLLMEYIDSGKLQPDFWEKLGVNLASMHSAATAQYLSTGKYGFYSNNYIGAGNQKNTPKNSWIEFFSECRLRPHFYDAYFDVMNMVPGYEERRNLYNLYHLTNHLNLFGNSYLPEVLRIIRWYT